MSEVINTHEPDHGWNGCDCGCEYCCDHDTDVSYAPRGPRGVLEQRIAEIYEPILKWQLEVAPFLLRLAEGSDQHPEALDFEGDGTALRTGP